MVKKKNKKWWKVENKEKEILVRVYEIGNQCGRLCLALKLT